jgi:hypothetical protein
MGVADTVRSRVRSYQANHGVPGSGGEADAFAPFWLHAHHKVSPQEATAHSSAGSGDRGLDGFHIDARDPLQPVLNLYQAKYYESRAAVKDGIADLTRVLPHIAILLSGGELENPERNPVLARLRAALQKQGDLLPRLEMRLAVLHLCEDDDELVRQAAASAIARLADTASDLLPDRTIYDPRLIGPRDIVGVEPPLINPRREYPLTFEGAEIAHEEGARYYAGLGRLADLVTLYDELHDALFERNVRLYLYGEAQKGPASHMRQTLREICDRRRKDRLAPETFAMFHNGVTVYARTARQENGQLLLREPSVLNGCQTVKNAYFFLNDATLAAHLDDERWKSVPIPLRVVVTGDEEFVRRVAVSNNRQTEIRPSAFWANEPGQVRLAQRFGDVGVFYERQEGAYKNLRNSASDEFFEKFYASVDGPITLEELAQAIATAADSPALSVAAKVSSLFEETQYRKLFDERRLQHLELLVFLHNVLRWMPTALKDLRNASGASAARLERLPLGRFKYPCSRVVARYVVATRPADVRLFGREVLGSARRRLAVELRDYLSRMLSGRHTGLARALPEVWGDELGGWANPLDAERARSLLGTLDLERLDVFSEYAPPHATA